MIPIIRKKVMVTDTVMATDMAIVSQKLKSPGGRKGSCSWQ